jgi:hypothetical protein
MFSAFRGRRAAYGAVLALALCVGCGRWQPAKTYEVTSQGESPGRYGAVLEVVNAEKYKIASQDPAAYRVRIVAKASDKSFIDIEVAASSVRLSAAGNMVRGDKVHKQLNSELKTLEKKLSQRLGGAPAAAPGAPATAQALVPSGLPQSWSEPASDAAVWGSGNFTCLPVRVPPEHKAALTLKLSTGENADVELSLAYAPELCRSSQHCKVSGGCPALGIGDSERVNKLAVRLKKGELSGQATLFDGASAVVGIDLSKHGSIAQSLSEMK